MQQQTVIEGVARLIDWAWSHPLQLVTIIAVMLATAYVVAAAIFAVWQAHEERKQDEQRKRLEALINLSESAGRKALPPPLGARPPRPRRSTAPPKAPGHPSTRVS